MFVGNGNISKKKGFLSELGADDLDYISGKVKTYFDTDMLEERTERIEADTELAENLAAETAARIAADSDLQSRLLAEFDKKAEKGVLSNVDIRSVSAPGIYSIKTKCTGFPAEVVENEWGGAKTLIVSGEEGSYYGQYLLLSSMFPSKIRIYFASWFKQNETVITDVPWSLVYDGVRPLAETITDEDSVIISQQENGIEFLKKAHITNIFEKMVEQSVEKSGEGLSKTSDVSIETFSTVIGGMVVSSPRPTQIKIAVTRQNGDESAAVFNEFSDEDFEKVHAALKISDSCVQMKSGDATMPWIDSISKNKLTAAEVLLKGSSITKKIDIIDIESGQTTTETTTYYFYDYLTKSPYTIVNTDIGCKWFIIRDGTTLWVLRSIESLVNYFKAREIDVDGTLSKDGAAADAKAVGDALQEKANTKMLKNTDISQISESGIYQVGSECSGLPDDALNSIWNGMTLIVSASADWDSYNQYLIANWYADENGEMTEYTRIYACYIYNPSGTPSYDMPWTLIYDTSIPQVTLDNTLSEEGAAADSKAVGDALNKKEDISFIKPTVFNVSNFYPSDSEPFAKYNEENGFVSLRSTVNGAWSAGQEYMNNFSFEVVNDSLNGINIIFAEDSEKYYMINCKHQSDLKYLGLLQNINKSTGKETGLTYKNSLSERNFENGEKILFRYIPNVTVAQDTVVNRYIVYRKKSCDVCFRQYLVFDFDVNVTPIVGFYSYDKISNSEIRGLYVDIDMPEYPVYNGAVLTNKSADDYILKLQNKKWWALGDSLTAFSESSYTDTAIPNTANYSENKVYGVNYINFVQSKTGCKVCLKEDGNNYGMSAHSLTDHNWSLWSRKDLDSWDSIEADIITLFAGTNDYYYSAPLGTLTDYINNTGISTFYGALKIYIDYFKTKNNIDHGLKIVLITPIQRFNDYSRDVENELGLKLIDYVNAIKNVGAYESITVVDLYNCGGIGANNAADVLRDGLHPNKIGYELIADKIAEGITSGYIFSTTSQAEIDKTLAKDGAAADAKTVGDALLEKADITFVEKIIPKAEASGNPVTIKDPLEGMPAIGYKIYGESVQEGTPSPDSPAPIMSVGDLVAEGEQSGKYKIPVTVAGKNMFDEDYFVESVNSKVAPAYKVTSEIIDGKNCIKVFGIIPTGAFNFLEFSENTPYTISFDYYDVLYNGASGLLLTAYYADGSTERIVSSRTSGDIWKHLSWTSAEGKTLERIDNSYSTGYAYTFFSAFQVEQGIVETSYSPYMSQEYDIYTDEPLRKVGDTADYIDYEKGQIVKNVDVIDGTGTKTVEESYAPRSEPEYIDVSLPDVLLPESPTARVEVETSVKGTFSIKYYQDINKKLKELQSLIALNIPSTLPAEILEE